MEVQYVKVGDIIRLTAGMAVNYGEFDNVFYPAGHPFKKATGNGLVYLDNVYKSRTDVEWLKKLLYDKIHAVFTEQHIEPEEDTLRRYLNYQVKQPAERTFTLPAGTYLVLEVEKKGSGQRVVCESYKTEPVFTITLFQGLPGEAANHNIIELIATKPAL